jgi:hypothetical protein
MADSDHFGERHIRPLTSEEEWAKERDDYHHMSKPDLERWGLEQAYDFQRSLEGS